MIQKLKLAAFFIVSTALSATATEPVPSDTLLNTPKAENISIISSIPYTSITINNINGSGNNFYYKSGQPNRKGSNTQTQIYFSDITYVTVCESQKDITITFTTNNGEIKNYSFAFADPDNRAIKSYIGSKGSDCGFTISKSNSTTWEVCTKGWGMGWITPLNAPKGMDISMWKSNEFSWLMALGIQMRRHNHTLSFGLGLNWQNFVTNGSRYFDKTADGNIIMTPYNEGSSKKSSRIQVFSLQLPVLYGFRFGHKNRLGFNIGPTINFNTAASIKTQYRFGGKEYSVKTNNINQVPVTVDALATINYRIIGLYFRYSPMDKLRSKTELGFGSFSTGLMLLF